jgi:outer membrane autotransporter protein
VTGALGVLMERYPSLDNQAIRTILLTTAKHLGDGSADVPNEKFGWGVPDLKKAMYGPGQFLGVFKANLATGIADTWSNSISEAALIQRQKEDASEIAAWIALPSQLPELQPPSNELVAGIAQGKALLKAAIMANTQEGYTSSKLRAALAAVRADPVGKQLLPLYDKSHPGWIGSRSESSDFDTFIHGRSDFELAQDLVNPVHAAIQAQIDDGKSRISYLQAKTAVDYVGSLIKTGLGTLTLTGDNSYSGGTELQGGTLGVGSSTALGTGTLAMSDATTLQAAADGLTLANAVTLSGIGNIDTQAFGMALSGNITDGSTPGGFAKLGTGTLTLSGANTYSGPTGIVNGTLRAGSTTGFSPNSTFFLGTQGQLDLANFDQTIGSLSGAGNVSLGTGTLTTGADNSTTAFSGQVAGTGGLTKTGGGVFTLANANTYSGATTVAAGTLQAGAVNTFSPASAMTVNTGATLNLAGYSQRIAGMNLAGTVSVAGATPGTTLTVTGPWTGDGGLLKLGTVSPGASDRVLLSGATAVGSGTTTVQIGNVTGLGGATTGNGIELIGTTGGASIQGNAFVLAGDHVVGGAYEYRLNNISSGGYLSSSSPQGQTYYRSEVPQYAALPAQLRQASLTMLGNMHQRTGDDDVKTASGSPAGTDSTSSNVGNGSQRRAWGRLISTNLDIRQSGTVSPQSHGRLDGFQAGTDLLSVQNWRAGVYVGQLDGDMGVSGFARGIQNLSVGRNDLRNQYLGAYGTYSADNGFYADAVLQAGRHRYDIVSPMAQSGSGGNGKGRSLLASVEVGQSFALGESGDWKVEPQFQLIHQHQSLDDAAIAGNTVVRQRPDSAWLARLGVRVKGEVGVGVARLQPYARFNLYRASGGHDVASFMAPGGRTAIASSTGGTSAELAAGATLALTPTFALYGELGKLWSAGGDTRVKSSVQASVGARVLW